MDLPDPGVEPGSPALQADSLSTELSGKPFPIGSPLIDLEQPLLSPCFLCSPHLSLLCPPPPQGLCHPASPWNGPEVERLQALSGQMVGILTLLGPSLSILALNTGLPVFKTSIQKMTELPLILITVHLPQPSSHPPECEGRGQSSRFQGLIDSEEWLGCEGGDGY